MISGLSAIIDGQTVGCAMLVARLRLGIPSMGNIIISIQ